MAEARGQRKPEKASSTWVPPGGAYRAVAPDRCHEKRASELGVRDSLLRPAGGEEPFILPGRAGDEEGDNDDGTGGTAFWTWRRRLWWWWWSRWWWLSGLVPFPLPWERRPARRLAELTSGGWQPTRVRFELKRWPADDSGAGMESAWFQELYKHIYVRTRDFAAEYFGYGDIGSATGRLLAPRERVWLEWGASRELRWYAQRVAKQDCHAGGWDALLMREKHRRYLVTGVIGKVLEICVFEELLFGAAEDQREMLEAQDLATLNLDGYERTELRCRTVRAIVAGDILTPEFWPCVDRLALQLTTMLLPLVRLMDKHFPKSRAKSLRSVHQDLHTIVSEAAYLSIAIRWSRDIFRFSSPALGAKWDMAKQSVDKAFYDLSRASIDRDDKIGDDGNTATAREAPGRIARVQIVLWPMLQRYAAAGETDFRDAPEGQHITTLFSPQFVCYCCRTNHPDERRRHHPTLDEWIRENERRGTWAFVGGLSYAIFVASLLLFLSYLAGVVMGVDVLARVRSALAESAQGLPVMVPAVLMRIVVVVLDALRAFLHTISDAVARQASSVLDVSPTLSSWVRRTGSA